MKEMLLSNLYRELIKEPNSSEAFIANVIYERYGKDRKKMLQGLYNLMHGGPKHFWSACDVRFADWSMDTIIATPLCCNENYTSNPFHRQREVDINNLSFYA